MRKKILIYSGTGLFPKIMASQDRVINMIIELSKKHEVDLVMRYRKDSEVKETRDQIGKYLNQFYPIKAVNPENSSFRRKYFGIIYKARSYITEFPLAFFYQNHPKHHEEVLNLIANNHYDIFQTEYWYFGEIFSKIKTKTLKVIDMHMLSYEDLYLYALEKYSGRIPKSVKKRIEKTRRKEIEVLNQADLLIPISKDDLSKLERLGMGDKSIIIHTGQDIRYFSEYAGNPQEKTIIFYGSMGGQQNIIAFKRFWKKIYPMVVKSIPDVKVVVIGSHPPEEIKALEKENKNVTITGFVDDVREYISKGKVMILPLEVGVGFRSRVVEVMAMGVPVVGTHNALDNIEMENAVHGFISDSDDEMAEALVKILKNKKLFDTLSANCRKFSEEKFSIEKTYGKLSDYYFNIQN